MAGRSIPKTLWVQRWPLLAAIFTLAAVAWFGPTLLLGPKVAVEMAIRRNVVQTVVAIGHVQSPYRLDVGSQLTGVVVAVPVEEGQIVREGELLVVLDEKDLRATVDQATSAVDAARSRLGQIEEVTLPAAQQSLAQAEATLTSAEKAYDRTYQLQTKGFATMAQLDKDRRDRDVAMTQVRSARLSIASNQPGGSDIMLAQHELAQAEATLRSGQARLAYTRIAAPRDGTLIARSVERGDVVQPGRVLMTLSPAGEVQLVVQIDEKNLGLIALGNKALASTDAFPKQTFEAEIVFINPSVDLQRASVEVKLRVPAAQAPAYLRQDMTVSVDIEVARKNDAVVLPLRFVHDIEGPAPWVLTAEAGHARRKAVKIGLRGGTQVEIAEGIAVGDRVIPPNAPVTDGQRIRSVP